MATTALGAIAQRLSGEALIAVTVVQRHLGKLDHGSGLGKQLTALGQLGGAMAVGQEAVMPNPLKPVR